MREAAAHLPDRMVMDARRLPVLQPSPCRQPARALGQEVEGQGLKAPAPGGLGPSPTPTDVPCPQDVGLCPQGLGLELQGRSAHPHTRTPICRSSSPHAQHACMAASLQAQPMAAGSGRSPPSPPPAHLGTVGSVHAAVQRQLVCGHPLCRHLRRAAPQVPAPYIPQEAAVGCPLPQSM
jgi:hypothetical protein